VKTILIETFKKAFFLQTILRQNLRQIFFPSNNLRQNFFSFKQFCAKILRQIFFSFKQFCAKIIFPSNNFAPKFLSENLTKGKWA
jgi:hypothetical protein